MIRRAGRYLQRIAAVAVILALLGLVLWQAELLPHPWPAGVAFCAAVGLVALAVGRTAVDLLDALPPAHWFGAGPAEHPRVPASTDHRLMRLRHLVRDAVERGDRPERLQVLLSELTADRLAARGIDLDADPQAASAVLPPELARYLAEPPDARPPSRRTLTDVVARIEEL